MEGVSQLYVSAALPPGEDILLKTEWEVGWAPGTEWEVGWAPDTVWTLWRREKDVACAGIRTYVDRRRDITNIGCNELAV